MALAEKDSLGIAAAAKPGSEAGDAAAAAAEQEGGPVSIHATKSTASRAAFTRLL